MKTQLLFLCFTVLLAGCLNPVVPELPDVDVLPELTAMPAFLPTKVGIGGDAETSLHVSPDGQTVLACSHGGFTQPSPLWFSTDAGVTFERYVPVAHPPSGDCDVSIGPEGNWYMIYDTIYSTSVARSTNNGESWQIVYNAALPIGGVDRPWIRAAGSDVVYLTYANVMVAEPAIDMFAKSTDGGETWVEQRLMSRIEDPTYPNTVVGRMVLSDDNRTIRVPLARTNANGDDASHLFDIATSRDGGATWTNSRVAGPVDGPLQLPPMTRAGDGTLYFVTTTGSVSNATVSVLASTDEGSTWSEPIVVAKEQNFPGLSGIWIDGRSDGSATLAWMRVVDVNGTEAWVVTVARLDAGHATPLRFVGDLFEPATGNPPVYEFLMVKHDEHDRAHVLFPLHGEGCKDSPPAPPTSRNAQCIWLYTEAALSQ